MLSLALMGRQALGIRVLGARLRVPAVGAKVGAGAGAGTASSTSSVLGQSHVSHHQQRLVSTSCVAAEDASATLSSPPPPPPRRSFWSRHPVIKYTLWGVGSIGFGLGATIALILAYDFTTYHEAHVGEVPISELALHPVPGGPKNLPVLSAQVDDLEDDRSTQLAQKEHLVIAGGGWGAVALLQSLDPDQYHVTLVAPSNYFLFTPLLPSAAVGTVEPRSLVENLRRILLRLDGHYIQGKAVDVVLPSSIDPELSSTSGKKHLLEVAAIQESATGEKFEKNVYVPYDKLVIACGSTTSDHGVPGLEHSYKLKCIADVRSIRAKIINNLEVASLPTTTPTERDRLLSFVVCGGGPTGVETAAEIFDLMNEDVTRLYPKIIPAHVKVSVIQSREHILNTYSERISEFAEKKFARDGVELITNARVKSISPECVQYTLRNPDNNTVQTLEIPTGFTLWSTGIALNPFTKRVQEVLPNQHHLKALMVDSHLRVKGAPVGSIYALGDAATMDNRLIEHLYEWVEKYDRDQDGQLTYGEFADVVKDICKTYPLATKHVRKLDHLFKEHDTNQDNRLSANELATLLLKLQSNMTSYPPTAQTASQQGKYLGKMLNAEAQVTREHGQSAPAVDQAAQQPATATTLAMTPPVDWEAESYPSFSAVNFGSLAYLGSAAAFDIPFLPEKVGQFAGGLVAMYVWRSFYLSEQVDSRTRLLLLFDYVRRGCYGRDMSQL